MPTYLTLAHLDDFLRAVWVECYGYLSRFVVRDGRDEILSIEEFSEENIAEQEILAAYNENPKKLAQQIAREQGLPYEDVRLSLDLWRFYTGQCQGKAISTKQPWKTC